MVACRKEDAAVILYLNPLEHTAAEVPHLFPALPKSYQVFSRKYSSCPGTKSQLYQAVVFQQLQQKECFIFSQVNWVE